MRSRWGKRTISFLLMIVMLLGVVPGTAWAASVSGNTVTLTVEESTTVIIDGVNLSGNTYTPADPTIATVAVTGTTGTVEVATSETTSLPTTVGWSGKFVIQNQNNDKSNYFLKNTNNNNSSRLDLVSKNDATVWTITRVASGYTVRDPQGKYLYVSSGAASVASAQHVQTLTYKTGGSLWWAYAAWEIQEGSFFLNRYEGRNSEEAGGYTSGASDSGSRWNLYAVTETPSESRVTFTGIRPGVTTVKIGEETYTVIVNPMKEDVELWVGEEGKSCSVTGEVSNDDIAAFNTANGSVVTVSRSGGNLVFTPVGEGTIAAVLGNTQYTVHVAVPTYVVDITETDGTSVTAPIVIKKVVNGTTYDLDAAVNYTTSSDNQEVTNPTISWRITSDPDGAASGVDENGVVSFTGVDGTVQVSAYYTVPGGGGDAVYDTVTISVSKSEHTVPSDGTDDFPEYPNEGAIRFDKTATAVGNFTETGLAMVELSMTGVPYTKGSEIDVVIMIDMSSSMTTARITAARESAVEALQSIVTNEDGSLNDNRVAVYAFNGWDGSGSQGVAQNYADAVDTILDLQSYTTEAMVTSATSTIQAAIANNKTDDGTNYAAALSKCDEVLALARAEEGYNRKQFVIFVTDGEPTTGFAYEENGQVKDYGYNRNYNNGYASQVYTKQEYYSTLMKNNGVSVYTVGIHLTGTDTNAHTVLRKIAGTKEGNAYNGGEEYAAYAQFVATNESADKLKDIFKTFVTAIKQAATDVVVEDKISNDYSMVFKLPDGVTEAQTGGQDFYIQIVEYDLDENKERTGTPAVLEKFWIDETSGQWQHTAGGTLCGAVCTHVDANGNIKGTYFETSFEYDPKSQILVWKADKLDTKELALQYFVYLDHHGADGSGAAGTYPTNEYATISYKNYQDKQCQQEHPEPQLTYNGAQVSYVFYLVNENGEPVNRAGRVVPFAEAVYVTDVMTFATTWEGDGSSGKLDAHYLAQDKVPSIFRLYDDKAYYEIHVFADAATPNYFIIEGSTAGNTSTKVFNTKAGARYDGVGAYASAAGSYTSGQGKTYSVSSSAAAQMAGFDFANTTVAFAVTWTAELVPNTAVLDFGLPVIIDVATDDTLNGTVVGVRESAPAGVAINSGSFNAAGAHSTAIRDSSRNIVGNAYVVSGTSVAVVLDKVLDEPVTFYYEYEATFYDGDTLVTACLYSSVTLVPATNVLYEENYITGTGWVSDNSGVETAGRTSQSEKNEGPYGYDTAYQNSTGSSGTQFVAALTPEGNGRFAAGISFTFTGTGFDLIGSCSVDTATLMVRVNDAGGNYVKGYMVDTAFLNTHSVDGNGKIYQVPLVHETGLAWGTYTVTITGAYVDYEYQGIVPETMTLEIDGFRVYRTGAKAEHEAFVSGETGVTYVNILDAVQALNETIAYVDSTATGYDVSGYEDVGGPENEIYVKPGQSIALKTESVWHQVSLRSVTEKATSAVLKTEDSQVEYDIAHNTELYYALEDKVSGILTITNTGEGLLAVGNVKLYSGDTKKASLAAVSAEDLPVVYAMLSRPIDPVFRPGKMTLKTESVVQDGQKFVTLIVTASTDVRKLVVNGTAVWASNYTQVQQGLESEYVFKILQIVSPDEAASFEVKAVNADGIAAELYKISD